jgi:hypothetical protein
VFGTRFESPMRCATATSRGRRSACTQAPLSPKHPKKKEKKRLTWRGTGAAVHVGRPINFGSRNVDLVDRSGAI